MEYERLEYGSLEYCISVFSRGRFSWISQISLSLFCEIKIAANHVVFVQ